MDGTWAVTEQGPGGREPRTFEATFADGEHQAVEPSRPPAGTERGAAGSAETPAAAGAAPAREATDAPEAATAHRAGRRDGGAKPAAILAEGTSSSPAQVRARHEEINAGCDSLDALGALGGAGAPPCRCPAGYRP